MNILDLSITRRTFLKGFASSVVALSLPAPAFIPPREPYVVAGEVVSYIGPSGSGGFIGGEIVRSVADWDGVGYLCMLDFKGYGAQSKPVHFYDVDLVNFNRELPDRFWWNHSTDDYPNVHTYVRTRRYGETVVEAVKALNFASTPEWVIKYAST